LNQLDYLNSLSSLWFDIINAGLEDNHTMCPHYLIYEHKHAITEWFHSICSLGYCEDVGHWFISYKNDDFRCSERINIDELEDIIDIDDFIQYLEIWINKRLSKFKNILNGVTYEKNSYEGTT